jgi:glycosyltransferase involved in cell wall biosynthesis
MAADPQFRSLDRAESRRALGLPAERLLIGQLGAFDRRRGADVVLRALDRVRAAERAVSLVLSGSKSLDRHAPPDILGVGFVADSDMPALVNCLDVACVSLSDNAFGRASYPAKLCEAMACRIPVVATDLGPTRWMLDNDDRALAASGDPDTMAKKILARLREGRCNYAKIPSWDLIADKLEGLLLSRN